MATASLAWMAHALSLIGVKEVPGPGNSPVIARWLNGLKAWWSDDATPWCGVFVAHVLQKAGYPLPPHWYRARAWLDWGKPCVPSYGSVCVLSREGGGHVFFVTGLSTKFVWGIGGNQGDKVCEAKFDRARVLGFRWPAACPAPVPLMLGDHRAAALSGQEA